MILAWTARRSKRAKASAAPVDAPAGEPAAVGADHLAPESGQLVTIDEMRKMMDAGEHVVMADVRTERTYETSDLKAAGAVRLDPEHAVHDAEALDLARTAWLIPYCT
jgi:hypothetical protein